MDTDMTEPEEKVGSTGPGLATPRKRRRWLKVVLGLVILLCGFVLGSGVTALFIHKGIRSVMDNPDRVAKKITKRLSWSLGLSDEQSAKVKEILIKRQRAVQKIFMEAWPQVNRQLDLTDKEVTEVLNPKQAAKWKRKFNSMRKRWSPSPHGKKKKEVGGSS
jgi:hypothetical protein